MSKRSKLLVSMAQKSQTGTQSDQPKNDLTLLQNVQWSNSEKIDSFSDFSQNPNENETLSTEKFEVYPIFTEDGIELQESGKENKKPSVKILQDVSLSPATALNITNELETLRMVHAGEFIRLNQSFSIKPSENSSNNNIELTFIDLETEQINSMTNIDSPTLKDVNMDKIEPINIADETANEENNNNIQENIILNPQQPHHEPHQEQEEPQLNLEDVNLKEVEPINIGADDTNNIDDNFIQEKINLKPKQQNHEPRQKQEKPQHQHDQAVETLEEEHEGGKGYTKKGEERKRKKIEESLKKRKEHNKKRIQMKHNIKPPCSIEKCKLKCINKISDERRKTINSMYWQLDWIGKKSFVLNCLSRTDVKRRTTKGEFSQRKNTFKYFLKNETGEQMLVCKCFFLTTLGYHRKNDWPIHAFVRQKVFQSSTPIYPKPDGRGKAACKSKIPTSDIDTHIESFKPNRRYLPSDLTIERMHKDYLDTYPHSQCSYEVYRKRLKYKNISFTNLGHEECELCEGFKLHNQLHSPENLDQACTECNGWKEHIQRAKDSRDSYRLDTNQENSPTTLKVSVDLQKVIMLPRLEMFKKVIFTQRISAFNESFVPLGKTKHQKAFACLWHDGIAGRGKEEIISSFNAFFLHNRDIRHFVLWVDNCSGQNKNWTFLSFLVYIVNSDSIEAEDICIKYFEPGHTFMSADSFHHQVELSLKKQKKTYDFGDFVSAVGNANSKKVEVKTMECTDFFKWQDFSSQTKIKNLNPRPYLAKISQIVANRGSFSLKFKLINDSDNIYEMDFLQNKVLKNKPPSPKVFTSPCGVSKTKKETLLKNLTTIIPSNRLQFWKNLPEENKDK